MNEEEVKDTSLRFQNKSEVALAIQVLTPFTRAGNTNLANQDFPFAVEKIKELTKLL